jgi:coatomer subunit beta
VALWILGEYATSQKDIDKAFETIKKNVGTLPLFTPEQASDSSKEELKESSSANQGPKIITKTIILPDGSYGTETIVVDDPAKAKAAQVSSIS